MKHLLVLTPEYLPTSGGGIVTFYAQLLPAIRASGVRVTVLVGSAFSQPGTRETIDGIEVFGLAPDAFATRLAGFGHCASQPELARHLAAAWALHDLAATVAPDADVVEATDWGLLFVPWVLATNLPLVVRCHGSCAQIAWHESLGDPSPATALLEAIESWGLRRASSVATYSSTNAAFWRERLGRSIEYVPPAQPLLERASATDAHWLVLARVQQWKGPHVLAQAISQMPGDERVRWIGRDVPDAAAPGRMTSESLAAAYPDSWGKRIVHQGTVPAAEARASIRRARGVIVPSTWDMFNFTVVEAMASGAMVVASRGAGASELISDGATGFLFDAGDAIGCADAMCRASTSDADARVRIGEGARARIAESLDPERVAKANLALYRAILASVCSREAGALDALLRPSRTASREAIDATLAQLPLRAIGNHVASRVGRKLHRL